MILIAQTDLKVKTALLITNFLAENYSMQIYTLGYFKIKPER